MYIYESLCKLLLSHKAVKFLYFFTLMPWFSTWGNFFAFHFKTSSQTIL